MPDLRVVLGLLAWALPAVPAVVHPQSIRNLTVSKQYHQQKELKARIEFAAGHLQIQPGPRTLLYRMNLAYDEERFVPISRLDPTENELLLGLDRRGSGGLRVSSREHLEQEAEIELSPDVDLSLEVELGAVDATLELGGLKLKKGRIATAASRAVTRFSRPNPGRCDSLALNAGAADFSVIGLGNSRCVKTVFEGGVGAVNLDLTGAWAEDGELSIRLAVGELRLRIPKTLGVELTLEKFLSSFQPRGFAQDGKTYRSLGYAQAERKIRIDITSAVGGVNVEWVGP